MIRFSAFLVVVAVGLLVAGVVMSKLVLVYLAIGVSGVALLALGAGAAFNWSELFGKPKTAEPAVSGLGRNAVPAFVPDAQPEARQSARMPAAPAMPVAPAASPWAAAPVPPAAVPAAPVPAVAVPPAPVSAASQPGPAPRPDTCQPTSPPPAPPPPLRASARRSSSARPNSSSA